MLSSVVALCPSAVSDQCFGLATIQSAGSRLEPTCAQCTAELAYIKPAFVKLVELADEVVKMDRAACGRNQLGSNEVDRRIVIGQVLQK